MCEADGCDVLALYGSEADDLALFCQSHSRSGDVHLKVLRCVEPGCDGPRSFGTAADGVALRCREHRGEDFTSRATLRAMARARQADAAAAAGAGRGSS